MVSKITVNEEGRLLIIQNDFIKIIFNLETGFFDCFDKKRKFLVLSKMLTSLTFRDDVSTYNIASSTDSYEKRWRVKETARRHTEVFIEFLNHSKKPNLYLSFTVFETQPFFMMRLKVKNTLPVELRVDEFRILNVLSPRGGHINIGSSLRDWSIYRSTGCVNNFPYTLRVNESEFRALGRDSKVEFKSDNILAIKNLATGNSLLMGFVTMAEQFAEIECEVELKPPEYFNLIAKSTADGYKLLNGEFFASEKLYVNFKDNILDAFSNYADSVKEEMSALSWDHIPTGWTPYSLYHPATEEIVIRNLEFFSQHKDAYPIEYIQIDFPWSKALGDLEANEKYPHGMKWLAEKIKEKGFKPGLWVAPFLVYRYSTLFSEHQDWLVKGEDGNPKQTYYWNFPEKDMFILDTTHPAAQDWLRKLFDTIVNDWGYDYVKLDFIDRAATEGIRYNKNVTRVQAFRQGLKIIRESVGNKKFILGGTTLFGSSVGLVNAVRIGADLCPLWKLGEDVPSAKIGLKGDILNYYLHKKFWINDPDFLFTQEKGTRDGKEWKLSPDEYYTVVTVISLSGGTILFADDMTALSHDRLSLLSRVLPPYGEAAIPLDLFEGRIPQLLNLKIEKNFETWYILGVINWDDGKNDIEISFDKLGLDINKEYHIYSFWEKKYYGTKKEGIILKNMEPHSCKLFSIREVLGHPQLLSTSFHITQGGVEISNVAFNKNKNILNVDVTAPGKKEGKVLLYLPKGFEAIGIQSDAKKYKMHQDKSNVLSVELVFVKKATFTITFTEEPNVRNLQVRFCEGH